MSNGPWTVARPSMWIVRTDEDSTEGHVTQMHNPPHPGEVLKETVLRTDGDITVSGFANHLGVSRAALRHVLNCEAPVSVELAIRLAAALRGSAESWLRMQLTYDLWHARKRRRPKIEPLRLLTSPARRTVPKRGAETSNVVPSSGNVFVDLGLPDATELDTKVRLAVEINRMIKQQRITDPAAAGHFPATRREISALRSYELDGFSAERLKRFLLALGGGTLAQFFARSPLREAGLKMRRSEDKLRSAGRVCND
jgi:antitoxin HigA-1